MVLNYIWIGFFLIALIVGIIKSILGDTAVFGDMVGITFDMAKAGFEISLYLTGILCLWLGIMKIGEKGGSVKMMSRLVGPFFNKLFPDVPEDHPARGSMLMNFSANMLGLDNAATPMGLKAMNELQELNADKKKASNAMIMFLVLNTSGLTLIPVTVMTYRAQYGAENPADIFLPILISTYIASLIGLIAVAIYQRINLFDRVILSYLLGMTSIIGGIFWYFQSLPADELETQSSFLSNLILFGIICLFIIMALTKKVNVYEAFIEGAKGGFDIAIKIIPYLVAILVSIGVFRASGAMDYLIQGMELFFGLFTDQTEFVNGLPTAFMKPLSGSGARGMMLDAFETHGVDSFIGKLTATLQGATDTTFYIIAVYFGSVGIRNTRYAIKAGLLADLGGVVAGIIVATAFFGGELQHKKDSEQVASEFIAAWTEMDAEGLSNNITDNCLLYDQAYDTIASRSEDIINHYLIGQFDEIELQTKNNIEALKTDEDLTDHFVIKIKIRQDSSVTSNTYELIIRNEAINEIKYYGNF